MSVVRFENDVKKDYEMDQDQAKKMFEDGAVLILLDVPTRTEFGIDLNSWNTGDKFMGVKMIPPGLHFIYYSAANSSSGDLSPRTGFFHWFSKGELLAFRWDSKEEILKDEVSSADCERMREDLKNLDRNLGAYPFQSWSKWIMLTSRISKTDMERMVPDRKTISSASEMLRDSDIKSTGDLPTLIPRPGTQINFTQISRQKYPDGSSALEISKHSLDSTYQLELFMKNLQRTDEILSELQFSFLCFLVGQNYDSFEHWKLLVDMVCGCSDGLLKFPTLYIQFISDIYFQMQEIPEDFFVDIISQNNFLVRSLTNLFENIRETEGTDQKLRTKAQNFEQYVSSKFGWCFADDADEDNLPVVLETLAID